MCTASSRLYTDTTLSFRSSDPAAAKVDKGGKITIPRDALSEDETQKTVSVYAMSLYWRTISQNVQICIVSDAFFKRLLRFGKRSPTSRGVCRLRHTLIYFRGETSEKKFCQPCLTLSLTDRSPQGHNITCMKPCVAGVLSSFSERPIMGRHEDHPRTGLCKGPGPLALPGNRNGSDRASWGRSSRPRVKHIWQSE